MPSATTTRGKSHEARGMWHEAIMQLLLWAAGRGRQGNSLVKEMRIRKQQENCVEIKKAEGEGVEGRGRGGRGGKTMMEKGKEWV